MTNDKLMLNEKCKMLNALAISSRLLAKSYFNTLHYLFIRSKNQLFH